MYLKQGDKVIVIAGKDKGKEGNVTKLLKSKDRVIVEGINLAKKHQKAGQGNEAGIIEKEMGIHVSNVMLVDEKDNKPTRVGYTVKDGKKVRVSKRSGNIV